MIGPTGLHRDTLIGNSGPVFGEILFCVLLEASAGPVLPGCPDGDAITAELHRLGTAEAVARFGRPEVTVEGAKMRVALRGSDGAVSGVREVAAPSSCGERAQVAAVLISAWVGVWSAGSFSVASPPPVASPSSARAATTTSTLPARTDRGRVAASLTAFPPLAKPPEASAPVAPSAGALVKPAAPARLERRGAVEVAGFGYGVHDGDAGTVGGGVQAGLRFPGWLGIDAAFAASGQRQRAVTQGAPWAAAYRGYGFGVGLNLRRQSGRLLTDFTLLPELTLLAVDGKNLGVARSVTRWGAATTARLRVGIALGHWRPFLLAGGSYAMRGERLTVDGYGGQSIVLSRWSFSLGLGLAYVFGGAK
jgi:hypothetical protein